ncbi:MAG: hypothetical protein SGARI_000917 [Bacillariaceae sp.]
MALYRKAIRDENDGVPFQYVICVGDLVNKGPFSAKVVRQVRLAPNWFSVRGNHDDGALQAALGDEKQLKKKKYEWIVQQQYNNEKSDNNQDSREDPVLLSDEDVTWLSELPYTIRIPKAYMGGGDDNDDEDEDTLIVHAGLEQEIEDMIIMRDLTVKCDKHGNFKHYNAKEKGKKKAMVASSKKEARELCDSRITWASAWFGPERVVFGHNAKRGLQLYDKGYAIGLDTGAVYGGQLTGLILPGRKLVSVQSQEYEAKGGDKSKKEKNAKEDDGGSRSNDDEGR